MRDDKLDQWKTYFPSNNETSKSGDIAQCGNTVPVITLFQFDDLVIMIDKIQGCFYGGYLVSVINPS